MAEQHNKRVILRRILGIVLIISAAALVFPRLFDGSGVVPNTQRVAIPPPPVVQVPNTQVNYLDKEAALAVLAEPLITQAPQVTQALDATEARDVSEAPSMQAPLTAGWVVQLGTFSEAANAERLVEQVRAAGQVAFVRDLLMRDERVFYQVMVGPLPEESQARSLKNKLDEQFSVSGLVLNYTP